MSVCKLCIKDIVDNAVVLQITVDRAQTESNEWKEETWRLQKACEASSKEIMMLMKQIQELHASLQEKERYVKRVGELEKEKKDYELVIMDKDRQLEEDQRQRAHILEGIHQLRVIVNAKDEAQNFLKSENETLKLQINGLNQLFVQSGSGDVARELACTQEKLQNMQSSYYQVKENRLQLQEKVDVCCVELEKCRAKVAEMQEHMKNQTQEIINLTESKFKMKEEMANQQTTISALQSERKRHLAEKNLLKTIYEKIKDEAAKTDSLEGSLTIVSQEANRLAIIADYNKQLGERFQNEIIERDEKIEELKREIKTMQEVHKASATEKGELCEQLTELCKTRDILNARLEAEVHRSSVMAQSAQEIENALNQEVNALQDTQKVERLATSHLLGEFYRLLEERDKLIKYKANAEKHLENLNNQLTNFHDTLDRKDLEIIEKENAIKYLQKQFNSSDEKTKYLTDKIDFALKKHSTDMEQLIIQNKNLLAEEEKHQDTVNYLKSNIYNLQRSLNQTRESENNYKKLYESEKLKVSIAIDEANGASLASRIANNEVLCLNGEFTRIKQELSELQNKHRQLSSTVSQKDEELLNLKSLERFVNQSEGEIRALQEQVNAKESKIESLEFDIEDRDKLCDEYKATEEKLREEISELASERDISGSKLTEIAEEVRELRDESQKFYVKIAEKNRRIRQLKLACQKSDGEIKTLANEIKANKLKIKTLQDQYESGKETYVTLEGAHKDLARKLLKSVHMLIDEKLARQMSDTYASQLNEKATRLQTEKVGLEQRFRILNDALKENKSKIEELKNYKHTLEDNLKEAVENYNCVQMKYDELIKDYSSADLQCQVYKNQVDEYSKNISLTNSETEDKINELTISLENGHEKIMSLQNNLATLTQDLTSANFQKTELELQLHDVQNQLRTEQTLKQELQDLNARILEKTLSLKENDEISRSACDVLVSVIRDSPVLDTQLVK